ncbi:MAG: hypothetical protein KGO50_14175 [Myxococcales bacterium]|nr:hypothetical protein [Myxococcales bacterium]
MTLLMWVTACGGTSLRYELPPPVPPEERNTVTLDPSEQERNEATRFLDARSAVLAFYDALQQADYEAAFARLSLETQLLFDTWAEGDGVTALRLGQLRQDAESYTFDPKVLFAVANPVEFSDDPEEGVDTESARRKEIHVRDADGTSRRIVLIQEGDQWVIHQPRIPMERLSPVQ